VLYNCLISFLYSFSFSTALALSSLSFSSIYSRCLITSLIVGAPYVLSLSYTLSAWLPRDSDNSITLSLYTPFFSKLLVVLLIVDGDGFFLGVASADVESESLVNRLSRLRGLPFALPYRPSLFLFSACSLSLMN
jgi:hypothetical protein